MAEDKKKKKYVRTVMNKALYRQDDTDQTLNTSRLPVKMHSVQVQIDDLIDPLQKLLLHNDPAVKMIEMVHLKKT